MILEMSPKMNVIFVDFSQELVSAKAAKNSMGKNYWEAEFTGLSHLSDFTDVCVVWFAKMSEFINLHKFGKTNKLWSPFVAKSGINQLDFASNSGCMLSKTSCYLCHGIFWDFYFGLYLLTPAWLKSLSG